MPNIVMGWLFMANYFLFLDELKPNETYKHFCLGGIFVEETHYRSEICNYVKNLNFPL